MPEGSHIDVTLKQTKDSAKNWKQDRHSRVPSSWLLKSSNELEENLDFRLQIYFIAPNKQTNDSTKLEADGYGLNSKFLGY
jgi:hypothetical protein